MNNTGVMAAAIQSVRAGRCPICREIRAEKKVESSGGFGQPTLFKTLFICGNEACPNYGKS